MPPTHRHSLLIPFLTPILATLPSCTHPGFSFSFGGLEERAAREETIPLPLKEGERLSFDEVDGSVEVAVHAAAEPTLHVRVEGRGRTREEAERVIERFRVRTEREGEGIAVRVESDPLEIEEGNVRMSIVAAAHFTATVPPGIELRARTSSGDIVARGPLAGCDLETKYGSVEASDVKGELRARSASGSIRLARARGETIEAESLYGGVTIEDVKAEVVDAESRSGDVRLANVSAPRIEVRSGYGDLELTRVAGDVEARTSSGGVKVVGATEGRLVLHTGYGPVEVKEASGRLEAQSRSGDVSVDVFEGEASVESGYGTLALEGIFRKLDARTRSGDLRVRVDEGSALAEGWRLSSGYGDVTFEVPVAFSCRIEAESGHGEVASDFHPARREDRKTLRGDVNEGGETVRLETRSGSVWIRRSGS